MNRLTSLSAGYAVYAALKAALGDKVTAVYPVVSAEDAQLPYAVYYRSDSQGEPTKSSVAFDICSVTVEVYAGDYDQSVELIESAREAIERRRLEYTDDGNPMLGLVVDCSRVVDSSEDWDVDCYKQTIVVNCKMI